MTTDPKQRHLVYFPYLALGNVDEIREGKVTVWNADTKLDAHVTDPETRKHVRALLEMNRMPGREADQPLPVRGIGVVSVGSTDFHPLSAIEAKRVRELRVQLFLAALSNNAGIKAGANAGHSVFTTENFDVVHQNFVVGSKYVSDETGFLVKNRTMGYTLSETRWFRPHHVPHPISFRIDERMLRELAWLRQKNRPQYRRILRAGSVFMESSYNAPNVDTAARVLLQLMAFEILLNIPDDNQRMHFKGEISSLCHFKGDRKRPYRSERRGGRMVRETGTIKQQWADYFYTLRNHLIHGEDVAAREFMFRRKQHHLIASPIVFVATLYRLIDCAHRGVKHEPPFATHVLRWRKWTDLNDLPERKYEGFAIEQDWETIAARHWPSGASHA